ncbi:MULTISPECIES: VOC family protein [unclassified Clostridium]|uniref:VOC family protein n=1 Tax=unclassified Clostridium TaxID=2614128 RepID=UPI0032167CFC
MNLEMVTIAVAELEESERFYKEILELKEVQRIDTPEGIHIIFLKDEESGTIELIEYPNSFKELKKANGSNISIVFNVNNFNEAVRKLEEQNVKVINGPMENYIFINDPNGVKIGIRQRH